MAMTERKAILPVAPWIGALLLGGCGAPTEDFIEAEGSYGDGRPLIFREQMRRMVCHATMGQAPCVSLAGLRLTGPSTEVLRGLRITYTPAGITAQTTYSSGLFQPVTFYVVQARGDRFVDSVVHGGQISFTSIATGPGEITTGTFRDMVLRRANDQGVEQTVVVLSRGSFQYLQP